MDFAARFAVLTHDLGKGLTPAQEWPRHLDHENRGLPSVKDVCARAGVDKAVEALALDVCKWHLNVHRALEMRSTSLLRFLEKTGLEGDPLLRERFIGACRADALGRLGKGDKPYFQAALLREACIALKELPSLGREAMNTREGQERHVLRLNKFRPIRAHYVQLHAGHEERATLD